MDGNKQPMRKFADLDWADWVCPCGATYRNEGFDPQFGDWLDRHRDHTDGTFIDTCTDRGATVWAEKPAPVCRPLPRRET